MIRKAILPAVFLGISACADTPTPVCSTTTLLPKPTEAYLALVEKCPAGEKTTIDEAFYIADNPVEQPERSFYLNLKTSARTNEQPENAESVQFYRNLLQFSVLEGDTSVEWTSSPGYKLQFKNGDVEYETPLDNQPRENSPENWFGLFFYDPFLGNPLEEVAVRSRTIYHRFHVVNKAGEEVSATEISPIHVHISWLTEAGRCRLEGLLQNYARGVKVAADAGVNSHPLETDFLMTKLYGSNFVVATDTAHLWVSGKKLIEVFDANPSSETLEAITAQMTEEQRGAYLARLDVQQWSRDQLIKLLLAEAPSDIGYSITALMQAEFQSFEPDVKTVCK